MKKSQILKSTFAQSLRTWPLIVKNSLLFLIILSISLVLLKSYFLYFEHLSLRTADDQLRLISQLGKLMVGLLAASFLVLLVPMRLMELDKNSPPQSFGPFLKKWAGPYILESFRMMASVIMWALLLILPGIYKQIRYSFYLFVMVNEEDDYLAGKINPVKKSDELMSGWTFPIFLLLLTEVLLSIGFDSLTAQFPFKIQVILFALTTILSLGISIFSYSLLFLLYLKLNTKDSHVTAV